MIPDSVQIPHLDCRQGSHDCWRSEAVSDQGEVSEMSLNTLVQDHGRFSVTQRRPVLIQQIHQLLCDQPVGRNIAIGSQLKYWHLILPTWWPAAILSGGIVPQCAPLSQIRTRPRAWRGTLTHRRNQSPWPSVSPRLEQQQQQHYFQTSKISRAAKNVRCLVGSILQTHDSMPFKLVTSSILRRKSNCLTPTVRWLKPFIIETCSFKIFVINKRQSGISSNL